MLQIRSSHRIRRLVEVYSRLGHCSERLENRTRLFLSRTIGPTTGLSWQTPFSRHTTQDRLRGVKIVVIAKTSTLAEATGSLILDITVMTTVECLRPLRGVVRTCPGGMMIGTPMVMNEELHSTQESLGSIRA